jgi:hypothetical protein
MTSTTTNNASSSLSMNTIPGVTRIQDVDGFIGTIFYVGPVASAKDPTEQYAGIVWDDPSRGKHDGSVICRTTNQLVRHFSCPHPCGASFIRLTKLNLGVALDASVFRTKYVPPDSELIAPNNVLPHTARTSTGREKPIEFYGELQIRSRQQVEDLNTISLRRMGIARYDKDVSLQEFVHLTTIDLAGNLFSDWEMVLKIMKEFPNLLHFSIAANRIGDPSQAVLDRTLQGGGGNNDDGLLEVAPFSHLKTLNLNQCGIETVQTLWWIGILLPQLQELCLAHANLSNLNAPPPTSSSSTRRFQQLQQLDLTNCQLSSWKDQITPFCSTLPCLEQLNLDDNPLETTNLDQEPLTEDNIPYFPQLTTLHLAGTQLRQWKDLDGLTLLPKLTTLRFRKCPLLSSLGTGEARALTIARLGGLIKLNASDISPKERIEAERRYVSSVACQLLQFSPEQSQPQEQEDTAGAASQCKEQNRSSSNNTYNKQLSARDEFLLDHKPFAALLEKHKDVIASHIIQGDDSSSPRSVTTSSSCGAAASSTSTAVVNVTIQSMAASSCHQEPLVRRLPGSLPIKRLKAMCARSFGLDPDLQRLHFCTEVRCLSGRHSRMCKLSK